ncbi:MAG: L-threonylcarbamoyladenylate synthase, partial [Myxococcota bacterium]
MSGSSEHAAARTCPGARDAAERLAEGELVAFPTETVWGLAAAARNEASVTRLFEWKGHAPDTAVSVLVESPADAEAFGGALPPPAADLAASHWPG